MNHTLIKHSIKDQIKRKIDVEQQMNQQESQNPPRIDQHVFPRTWAQKCAKAAPTMPPGLHVHNFANCCEEALAFQTNVKTTLHWSVIDVGTIESTNSTSKMQIHQDSESKIGPPWIAKQLQNPSLGRRLRILAWQLAIETKHRSTNQAGVAERVLWIEGFLWELPVCMHEGAKPQLASEVVKVWG